MLCGLVSRVDSSRLKVWLTDRLCSRGSTASEGSLQTGQQQANASTELVWYSRRGGGVCEQLHNTVLLLSLVLPLVLPASRALHHPATTSVMEPLPNKILAAKRMSADPWLTDNKALTGCSGPGRAAEAGLRHPRCQWPGLWN